SRARRGAARGWRTRSASLRSCGLLLGHEREEGILKVGELLARLRAQLVEGAFGDQTPTRDDADAISHSLGAVEDVGGQDDRAACGNAFAQNALDLPRGPGIEAGQRLVEDD